MGSGRYGIFLLVRVQLEKDLTHMRWRRRRRRLVKMCFYFTLEFQIYLELSSVTVGIKLAAAEHATNALKRKIRKALKRIIICCGLHSPD